MEFLYTTPLSHCNIRCCEARSVEKSSWVTSRGNRRDDTQWSVYLIYPRQWANILFLILEDWLLLNQRVNRLYAIMLRTKRLIDNGRLNLFREPPEALLFALQVETRRILRCGINNLNNQRSQSRSQSRRHRARPNTSTSSLVTEDQDSEPVTVNYFCTVTMVENID